MESVSFEISGGDGALRNLRNKGSNHPPPALQITVNSQTSDVTPYGLPVFTDPTSAASPQIVCPVV